MSSILRCAFLALFVFLTSNVAGANGTTLTLSGRKVSWEQAKPAVVRMLNGNNEEKVKALWIIDYFGAENCGKDVLDRVFELLQTVKPQPEVDRALNLILRESDRLLKTTHRTTISKEEADVFQINDKDMTVLLLKSWALRVGVRSKDPRGGVFLEKFLKSERASERQIGQLTSVGPTQGWDWNRLLVSAPYLSEFVRQAEEKRIRVCGRRLSRTEAIETIATILTGNNWDEIHSVLTEVAVQEYQVFGDERLFQKLIELFHRCPAMGKTPDDVMSMKSEVLSLIVGVGGARAIPFLSEARNDPDSFVRSSVDNYYNKLVQAEAKRLAAQETTSTFKPVSPADRASTMDQITPNTELVPAFEKNEPIKFHQKVGWSRTITSMALLLAILAGLYGCFYWWTKGNQK